MSDLDFLQQRLSADEFQTVLNLSDVGRVALFRPIPGGDPYELEFEYAGPLDEPYAEALQAFAAEPATLGRRDWANSYWRKVRDDRFERSRQKGRKIIMAIGDSWFHYPFGSDLIEWFEAYCAVKSYALAGDTLQEMVARREYASDIQVLNPQVFLISGGGNDILGKDHQGNRRIIALLNRGDSPQSGQTTDLYPKVLNEIITLYERIRRDLRDKLSYGGTIIVHGYDYPRGAEKGSWISGPLEAHGYKTDLQQMNALRAVMDPMNDALAAFAAEEAKTVYVDCRGGTGGGAGDWWDEIHPSRQGYEKLHRKRFLPHVPA